MIRFKRCLCILTMFSLMLLLFGCSRDVKEADSFLMKISDKQIDVLLENEDESIYCDSTPFKELVRVSKTDMSALCFSEESYGVSVYDAGSNTVWRSLPESYMGEKTGVICLDILIDGSEYTLNSQSDSKAMDCTSYEIKDDGIAITYGFRRTFSDGTKINITVPVEITGSDGTMSISVDCSALKGEGTDSNVVIKSISVLPYLGASQKGEEGDFLLIPDGSGLAVDTSVSPAEEEIYSVSMYSSEGNGDLSEEGNAFGVLPAFGMKNGDGAFVATVDKGDAISTVRAHRASANEGCNRVYAEFEITPTEKDEKGYYVSSKSYDGEIRLSYRFISKGNADYVGMATVCRELLTRNGALSENNVDVSSEYPFNLSIIGSAEGRVCTDFARGYDIVSSLKSKGINNINLRYRGILEGTDINKKLDSDGSFDEFSTLVSSQGISVFTDADIFTFPGGAEDKALTLTGDTAKLLSDRKEAELCGAQSIDGNMNALLHSLLESPFTGLCLNDGASHIYADYSKNEVVLKDEMRDILSKQANSVSATKNLMVVRGNLYSLKYADVIVELPDEAHFSLVEGCEQVPFVQTVLHGIYEYSHSPINLSESSTDAFLKAVEYGAIPYYEWHHTDEGTAESEDPYYYLNSTAQAKLQYDAAKITFADLRDEKITAHSKVADNVYLTVYGNNTEIYVNYSEEAVTVSGVTVEAGSFLRVN